MQFDPDNPKWTAFVLGELPEDERREFAQALQDSAEAQQYVEELRQITSLLSRSLASEPAAGLSAIQRASILGGAPAARATVELASKTEPASRSNAHRWYQAGAIALVALVAVTLSLPAMQRARESSRAVAVNDSRSMNKPDKNSEQSLDGDLLVTETMANHDERGQGVAAPHPTSSRDLRSDKKISDQAPEQTYETKQRNINYTINKPLYEQDKQKDGQAPSEGYISTTPVYESKTRPQHPEQFLKKGVKLAAPIADSEESLGQRGALSSVRVARIANPYKVDDLSDLSSGSIVADPKGLTDGTQPEGAERMPGILGLERSGESHFYIVPNTEGYDEVVDNAFLRVDDKNALSTFSIDVDTASYSNIRRFLTQNQQRPPKGAVRIEEMINYFRYEYPQPAEGQPFSTHVEVAGCPWNAVHRLVKIGLKGREIKSDSRPKSNLVFLLDVSGSMNEPNKLPLVKESMRMLSGQLTENDRVAIVVYAGASGLVLPSTTGNNKETIIASIDRLEAGGSTNGAQGIQLAYEIAAQNFIKGATNRVILATDGDFNVGITDRTQLIQLIQEQSKSGVFLTTLGFGMGNLKDGTLEQLADKGNGNYAYIDDLREARKVFIEEMSGTLVTIAKDVKIQIEFNPEQVEAFRLIGYENRILAHEDFNDDKKDAGEIGAGHTVTALYELVPKGKAVDAPAVDPLKYQQRPALTEAASSGELLTLKLRYKLPDADTSTLVQQVVKDTGLRYGQASRDFRFAAGVALFGMLLRDSPYKGTASWDAAIELAQEGVGSDLDGYRIELVNLIRTAKQLAGK